MQTMTGLMMLTLMTLGFGMGINATNGGEGVERGKPRVIPQYVEKNSEKETTSSGSSKLRVPVVGVRPRDLADTWGATRSEGRAHEGIDIFAKRNTPVVSATNGVIIRQGESERGGTVVWVAGADGRRHYYAHLEKFSDHVTGDRVRAGDTIGYVGNSGNAITTPPHLHYGVYVDTGAVNPYPLLVQR